MNERIKELAKESGFDEDGGEIMLHKVYLTHRLEKFAELIVKECCQVSLKNSHREDDMGAIISIQISKHFGFEEKKEQSDKEYVTREEFDNVVRLLTEMLDRKQNAPPSIVSPFVNKPLSEKTCWVCNLPMDKPMGYVCTHQICPSRVTCAVQNTNNALL